MDLNSQISERVLAKGSSQTVGLCFNTLAELFSEAGYKVRLITKGFIGTSMRFELNGQEPFSAILNKNSVLFYFRKPAFENFRISMKTIGSNFPEANPNNSGEITLKLENQTEAKSLAHWILKALP